LFCCFFEPFDRFPHVLCRTDAVGIAKSQIALRIGISLFLQSQTAFKYGFPYVKYHGYFFHGLQLPFFCSKTDGYPNPEITFALMV